MAKTNLSLISKVIVFIAVFLPMTQLLAKTPAQKKGLKAVVDTGSQKMRVYIDGKQRYSWKVSTGRYGFATPNGTYKPIWMKRMHYSEQYDNSPMPYSIFFHQGYAIHGTQYVGRLGRPASHGCVRLHTNNAKKLYDLVNRYGRSRSSIVITRENWAFQADQNKVPSFLN